MAVGKKTGGRRKGSRNKLTRAMEIAASGLLPLDYMLGVMRDEEADVSRRDDMAKASASYVHPKLATIEHMGEGGGPVQVVIKGDDASLL